MAKTLVGLYDVFADAERVVHDLVDGGFSRGDIRMVTHDPKYRDAEYTTSTAWDTDTDGSLVENLTELGVPHDDARSYTEGVRRGGSLVIVESSDDQADRGMEILNLLHPVDIRERRSQWQRDTVTSPSMSARSSTATDIPSTRTPTPVAPEGRQERIYTESQAMQSHNAPPTRTPTPVAAEGRQEGARAGQQVVRENGDVTVPIVEEDIAVGKRADERRVRVQTHVQEHPVEEQVRLRDEKITVERRPVDRPATDADFRAATEETIELTETTEEAVVSKRARVVEEVVVHRDVQEHTETLHGTARRTEVEVQRDPETHRETAQTRVIRSDAAMPTFEGYVADYRRHHSATFGSTAYADYEPAYRYGYELGTNERYRGRDWSTLEADARRDWELRHAGTWERFKEAIRYAWDSLRHGSISGTTSAPRTTTTQDFTSYGDDFRRHYTSTFASNGGAYIDYEPAYRYGYGLGTNERYRDRDWAAIEADARRDWEREHTGTWERFKDAVRYGWDKIRGRA